MSTLVSVREAGPADVDAVVAINEAGRPGVFALGARDVAAELERCPCFLVAERVGTERPGPERMREAIGYLVAYTHEARDLGDELRWFRARYRSFLYVDQVAVAGAARRLGVGAALYAAAERGARGRGLERLACEVNLEPPNPASLEFHRRLGFEPVGELATGDGRRVRLLVKELPGGGAR